MARSDAFLIAHLLRRAGFGGSPADIEAYTALGFEGAVDRLINYTSVDDSELERVVADLRANNPVSTNEKNPQYGNPGLETVIWLTRMLLTKRPLQEKMTLYWHGHFTSSIQDVKVAPLMHKQNALLRANALTTNFKDFTRAIARDPAMLIYLDNNTNRKGKPNENWARELMELFTLSIGNYTENDVKDAARAFTGWTVNRQGEFVFNPQQHDDGQKTVLGVTGNLNGDDIINILLAQPIHPKITAVKLFAFFVHDNPDKATVDRFADIYVKSGLNIRELMRQLFLSTEFHSEKSYYSLVKSPVEYVIGAMRSLSARYTDMKSWNPLTNALRVMGQQIYAPPDVGGWPGNQSWVNSTAYYSRANLADTFVSVNNDTTIDPGEIAANARITTPEAAVDYFLSILVQGDIPTTYRSTLISYMGKRGTTQEWDGKLRGLVRLIMSSPVYQMN